LSIKRLNIQTTQTTLAKGKPFDADLFSDHSETVSTDFGSLALQWNNSLVPLLALMTDGSQDSLVNAYKDGADARTVYVDSSADTSAPKIRYYNVNRTRPKTIKEMIDELYGSVAVAGTPGKKGDKGDPGVSGSNSGISVTFTTLESIGETKVNATASVPTVDAEFFLDFDKLGPNLDIYISAIGKIAAATYAAGIAVWASNTSGAAAGPNPPYDDLGEILLGLISFPIAGTPSSGAAYKGYDLSVVSLANPGGKKYITVTSFAGATTPASDTGAITLTYRGLTINIKNHG
jgi:hypothetical protein